MERKGKRERKNTKKGSIRLSVSGYAYLHDNWLSTQRYTKVMHQKIHGQVETQMFKGQPALGNFEFVCEAKSWFERRREDFSSRRPQWPLPSPRQPGIGRLGPRLTTYIHKIWRVNPLADVQLNSRRWKGLNKKKPTFVLYNSNPHTFSISISIFMLDLALFPKKSATYC